MKHHRNVPVCDDEPVIDDTSTCPLRRSSSWSRGLWRHRRPTYWRCCIVSSSARSLRNHDQLHTSTRYTVFTRDDRRRDDCRDYRTMYYMQPQPYMRPRFRPALCGLNIFNVMRSSMRLSHRLWPVYMIWSSRRSVARPIAATIASCNHLHRPHSNKRHLMLFCKPINSVNLFSHLISSIVLLVVS